MSKILIGSLRTASKKKAETDIFHLFDDLAEDDSAENILEVRIDRGHSPLANPFKMNSEKDRQMVCQKYDEWLTMKINIKDPMVCNELNKLYKLIKSGQSIKLMCWCAPKQCHAESIKKILKEKLS